MLVDAIIDADIAIKLGRFEKVKVIEEYTPRLAGVLYIHRHVYEKEIQEPSIVKEQIDTLIRNGHAIIVDINTLNQEDPMKTTIYESTISLLRQNLEDTVEGRKNWGEIVSIAYAKAKGITAFLSDESGLQALVDEHLNIGTSDMPSPYDIKIIRVRDFILWLKDEGEKRKLAKFIWLGCGDRSELERRKKYFDEIIWPI